MANLKIELNSEGIKELLRSSQIKAICEEKARSAVSKLGEGYVASSYTGKSRVNASVYAESQKARAENLENNTILKALR